MSLAIGRRNSPKGPSGRMSGSRNRFSRNGPTASSESGPPSWNSTIPTLFFPAKLLAPIQSILQLFDLFAQRIHPLRHRNVVHKENGPPAQIRCKYAIQIFHRTSASLRNSSTLARMASSLYRPFSNKISSPVNAAHTSKYEIRIRGSSPEPGPPRITGLGSSVPHHRIAK